MCIRDRLRGVCQLWYSWTCVYDLWILIWATSFAKKLNRWIKVVVFRRTIAVGYSLEQPQWLDNEIRIYYRSQRWRREWLDIHKTEQEMGGTNYNLCSLSLVQQGRTISLQGCKDTPLFTLTCLASTWEVMYFWRSFHKNVTSKFQKSISRWQDRPTKVFVASTKVHFFTNPFQDGKREETQEENTFSRRLRGIFMRSR